MNSCFSIHIHRHLKCIHLSLQKLHYVDILFEPAQKNNTFVIRGATNRTPYAEIDFDAHAEPLPVSCENSPARSSILNSTEEDGIYISKASSENDNREMINNNW